jgi:hypothetical protein
MAGWIEGGAPSETLSLPGLQWCKVHTRDIDMRKFVGHVDGPELRESSNSVHKFDTSSIRFDSLTKALRQYPSRVRGASPRPYHDQARAPSRRVPHNFCSRTRIGSSCEKARSAGAAGPRAESNFVTDKSSCMTRREASKMLLYVP